MIPALFTEPLARWQLTPDGEPFTTSTSFLLPVRFQNQSAMLKITHADEEQRGAALMAWWDSAGAARVLAHDGNALVMERATGPQSLAEMARQGLDDDACRIACEVAARLHAPRQTPAPETVPLAHWFRSLFPAADKHGGIWVVCADTAQELLAAPLDETVLHGDIHHGNILDFGRRGWRAIDPKGLLGERGFDYANLFCNPDPETATAPGRLARRADVVAEAAGLERGRLLRWVLAYAGLSAAWCLEDGDAPDTALAVAAEAAREIGRTRG